MKADLARIRAALHPLDVAPAAAGWNLDDVSDLLAIIDAPIPAAVLVGIVPREEGLQVLLTRRTHGMRHHAGQVSFPGGRVESVDRDACAAAVRETAEEVGIAATQIEPIGYLDALQTVTGFRVTPLVAVVAPDYIARPDPGEVDEVFEVALDYLMDAANLRTIEVELRGRRRSVLEFVDPQEGRRIWGVSASILLNLRQRLEMAR
jgi:8-oxo-dGTP pyrophosphatase MutT (NUDIX family)